MLRSETFWLTLTNILLGAALIVCVLILVLGDICDALSAVRKRRSYRVELNHDMREIFAATPARVATLGDGSAKPAHRLLEALCRICRRLVHRTG